MLEKELVGKDEGKSIYRYGDFIYRVEGKTPMYARNVHRVTRIAGDWPTDDELVQLVDDAPFGGRVHYLNGNEADVSVHTD